MQNLQQERLFRCFGGGSCIGCAETHPDWCQSRKAFGQELSRFQHIRFELAELATKIQVTQSFIDDLIPRHMQGEELTREHGKIRASDEFEVRDRLQLFGGYGYMSEYPISRYFLDARVQRIYGETNEIMKELIAVSWGSENGIRPVDRTDGGFQSVVWSFFRRLLMCVDVPVITCVIISPHHVQKFIPAVNPPRSFHRDFGAAKLVGSEVDGLLSTKLPGFRVEPIGPHVSQGPSLIVARLRRRTASTRATTSRGLKGFRCNHLLPV